MSEFPSAPCASPCWLVVETPLPAGEPLAHCHPAKSQTSQGFTYELYQDGWDQPRLPSQEWRRVFVCAPTITLSQTEMTLCLLSPFFFMLSEDLMIKRSLCTPIFSLSCTVRLTLVYLWGEEQSPQGRRKQGEVREVGLRGLSLPFLSFP